MAKDYLVHYNHNHDKLGRFARSIGGASQSVGSAMTSRWSKKKKTPPVADIKKGKAANTKLSDEERQRIVKSGTKEEVAANKDRMSTKELKSAVERLEQEKTDRIDLDRRLSDLNTPEGKAAMEAGKIKVEKAIETAKTIDQYKDTGIKIWNAMAQVHNLNAPENDKWPTFGKNNEVQQNGPAPDVYDLITKGSASDILANKDRLSVDELREAINRRNQYDELQKIADAEAVQKTADQEAFKDRTIFGKKNSAETLAKSGSMNDVVKNVDRMSDDQINQAIQRYESNQKRQQNIDKLKRYAEAESIKANRDRINNIPVQAWINDSSDGYVVENGKIFKKKVKYKKVNG